MIFPASSPFLIAYSVSDWANDISDPPYSTGYCIFLGNSLISWKGKEQSIVSRSSAEVEYHALADVTVEIIWVHQFILEMRSHSFQLTFLYCGNTSARHIAYNVYSDVFHECTNDLKIGCHLFFQHIRQCVIILYLISSANQLAELFAKSHSPRCTCMYL